MPVGLILAVAAVIVPLDVVEAHGLGDAGHLVEIAQVIPEIRIVDDAPQVALEVAVVDRVETHQRGEQPPVGFGDLPPDEIALAREPRFELVERGKDGARGFFVGVLRAGEAGAIDAVVDVGVDGRVDAVDLGAQRSRIVVGMHVGECRRTPNSACG